MNDEMNESQKNEYDALMQRAEMLGLKIHPKTGLDKLRARVNNTLESGDTEDEDAEDSNTATPAKPKAKKAKSKVNYLTHEQFLKERTEQIRKEINRLVRVRVSCMNPNKSQWEGEIISVGSARRGTFKKYVPFNLDEGYHIPKIIYEALKERKYTQFYNVRGPRGEKLRKGRLVPEFNIEVLPPLTPDELKKLAQRQAMAKGTAE